jgi:energy-converting hydrogenase Eha subunit A
VSRSAKYTTLIVVAHLLANVAHGFAHRELRVGLTPSGSFFVIVVVLVLPLLAMGLVWISKKQLGLILLSSSMLAALIFGLYHHFLAAGADHIHSQPSSAWGVTFVFTAYALLITEAMGTYVGINFLRLERHASNKSPATVAR